MFKKKRQYPNSGKQDEKSLASDKQSPVTSTVKIKEQKRNQDNEHNILLELQIENLKIQHEQDLLAKDKCLEEQKSKMTTIIKDLQDELETERKEKLASLNENKQLKEECQKVKTDVLQLQKDTLEAQIVRANLIGLGKDLETGISNIEKDLILLKEELKESEERKSQRMQNFKAVLQTKNKERQENLQVLETCKTGASVTHADLVEINRLQILQNTTYITNLGKLLCDAADM